MHGAGWGDVLGCRNEIEGGVADCEVADLIHQDHGGVRLREHVLEEPGPGAGLRVGVEGRPGERQVEDHAARRWAERIVAWPSTRLPA